MTPPSRPQFVKWKHSFSKKCNRFALWCLMILVKIVPFVARSPEAPPFPKNSLVLKRNTHHSVSPDLATTPQCRLALGCTCLSYSLYYTFSNLESYSPYESWRLFLCLSMTYSWITMNGLRICLLGYVNKGKRLFTGLNWLRMETNGWILWRW